MGHPCTHAVALHHSTVEVPRQFFSDRTLIHVSQDSRDGLHDEDEEEQEGEEDEAAADLAQGAQAAQAAHQDDEHADGEEEEGGGRVGMVAQQRDVVVLTDQCPHPQTQKRQPRQPENDIKDEHDRTQVGQRTTAGILPAVFRSYRCSRHVFCIRW